jgi:phospholipase/carboxylesterase
MILIHGRGADAESILQLVNEFNGSGFAYAAPQAKNNTWYPNSFLFPIESNEPGITSGINKIDSVLKELNKDGIPFERIILLGFSQGACLTLEFAVRNTKKYGGIVGLSGGLIGPDIIVRNYSGSFEKTPVFLGCSDVDPHIPLERVHFTKYTFETLSASVTERIYKNMGHTINKDEINFVNELMNQLF